ncbi:MAG: hypothetical protein AB7J19_17140 [Beijerinckiaceae bacterium]
MDASGAFHSIRETLPPKPKGMHWPTYRKLLAKLDNYETITDAPLATLLQRMLRYG